MIIMMPPHKVRGAAKRLRRFLRERGIKIRRVASLNIAARLCGFERWEHYLVRDIRQPLSPFDHDLAEGRWRKGAPSSSPSSRRLVWSASRKRF
ncbi:hypothetical protein [Bradyrhizobium sp. MOS002]|uniref:hypothetical protein n=1 Tax=Bradyrhizobium sp. MOS002 TaxID=2133947 RepID=UPI0011B2678C|nr:hypothetical protein [Bradyrhizobium sp. MOS002]